METSQLAESLSYDSSVFGTGQPPSTIHCECKRFGETVDKYYCLDQRIYDFEEKRRKQRRSPEDFYPGEWKVKQNGELIGLDEYCTRWAPVEPESSSAYWRRTRRNEHLKDKYSRSNEPSVLTDMLPLKNYGLRPKEEDWQYWPSKKPIRYDLDHLPVHVNNSMITRHIHKAVLDGMNISTLNQRVFTKTKGIK